jgi:mRNA interferase RelE/StbE
MSYEVWIPPDVWRDVRRLPGHVRQRIKRAINDLKSEPRPSYGKRLEWSETNVELWRLRLDRWRVVYLIDETDHWIGILTVRKRPPYDYGDLTDLLVEVMG